MLIKQPTNEISNILIIEGNLVIRFHFEIFYDKDFLKKSYKKLWMLITNLADNQDLQGIFLNL